MHVSDPAKDFILKYHTKKGDSFSFEELTKCMFDVRETFPHRVACDCLTGWLKVFRWIARLMTTTLKRLRKKCHPQGSVKINLCLIHCSEVPGDEWESFPAERDIILDNEDMLGILLSHQNIALNHHFYHITRRN